MRALVRSIVRIAVLRKPSPLRLVVAFGLFVGVETVAQTTLPVAWTANNAGAGNGVCIASDRTGNLVVVSGYPALVVTSYTADGTFRWSHIIPNGPGTLLANWVAAAPGGDFVVAGRRVGSNGTPYEAIVARYSNNGEQLWRHDIQTYGGLYGCVVGRLIVDAGGNAYLVGSFVGPNVDATILKYSPTGTLLGSCKDLLIANSAAMSPDGADLIVTGFVPGTFSVRTAAHDAATGAQKWFVNSADAGGGRDVVVDDTRVYVTGQGVTGAGTPAIGYHLTVIAYDRATGARLWRTDSRPTASSNAAGYRVAPRARRQSGGSRNHFGLELLGLVDRGDGPQWYLALAGHARSRHNGGRVPQFAFRAERWYDDRLRSRRPKRI